MLNDYYTNIGYKGFIQRYGVINALRRGIFMSRKVHLVKDYEVRKALWQEKASKKVAKYLKYKDSDPKGLEFSEKNFNNPIWVYWNKGMDKAPDIVKSCYASLKKYGTRDVILLTENNLQEYLRMPDYIEEKKNNGSIPLAGYTDLMRFALLEHYGGTWIDATVYLTEPIPKQILECDFFAFRNALGLLDNPVLYPAWFLHAKKHNETIMKVRNVDFAYWTKENHVIEYLLPNLIITQIVKENPAIEKAMPYLNSDYSEYLVRILGEQFTEEKWEWVKNLTGIHKLTYKLSPEINQEGTFYKMLVDCKL
ncbi:capsular polysaccharide synthesis protein [Anaerostipes faecalis]|uniref:capsular polysaccharide synthesis protein n=1 Tax=Anaerostipes faecalis TaxID=2738446 RepID=UPI003F12AA50